MSAFDVVQIIIGCALGLLLGTVFGVRWRRKDWRDVFLHVLFLCLGFMAGVPLTARVFAHYNVGQGLISAATASVFCLIAARIS